MDRSQSFEGSSNESCAGSASSTDTSNSPLVAQPLNLGQRFDQLPIELRQVVLDNLDVDALIPCAVANYQRARETRPEHFPAITRSIYLNLAASNRHNTTTGPLDRLPTETVLQILRMTPRRDLMAFALSNYRLLVTHRIVPALTEEDLSHLRLCLEPG